MLQSLLLLFNNNNSVATLFLEGWPCGSGTAVAVMAVTASGLWLCYRTSAQYRIESALQRQGIPAAYTTPSWPFLGHLAQFWDRQRLLLENMDRKDNDTDDDDEYGQDEAAPAAVYQTTLGHPLLVIHKAQWAKALWDTAKSWPKPKFFYQSIDALFATQQRTLLTHLHETDPHWQCKRSMVSHALQKKNLQTVADYIEDQVKVLCNDWIQRQTNIDPDPDLTNLTLRVIIYFIFGQKLQPADVQPLVQALSDMVHFAWDMAQNPLQYIQTWIPTSKPYRASRTFRQFVRNRIAQARCRLQQQQGNNNDDSFLIHAFLQKTEWTPEVLENEIMVLLFAGHDTTAHTTTIGLQECFQHQQIIQWIRDEHAALLLLTQSQADDDTKDKNSASSSCLVSSKAFYYKMKWPTAAFKETARLNPAAPGGTVRVAPHNAQLFMGGGKNKTLVIPAGCAVIAPMWIFSRSKGNWGPDATEFKPERFVSNGGSASVSSSSSEKCPCTFIPFALGKRNCVGMPLAYLEGSMLLGHILTHLDITVRSPVHRVWTMTLRAKNMLIDVKPRLDNQ